MRFYIFSQDRTIAGQGTVLKLHLVGELALGQGEVSFQVLPQDSALLVGLQGSKNLREQIIDP